MNKNCKGGCCGCSKTAHWLLVIGGLNWGLVGIGMLIGSDLNVVNMIFGGGLIEAIIYILVGLSAIVGIFGCYCKKAKACRGGMCGREENSGSQMPGGQAPTGQM